MTTKKDNESTDSLLEQQAKGGAQPKQDGPAGFTAADEVQTQFEVKNDTQRMRDHLASQPKVEVFVSESSDLAKNGLVPDFAFVQLDGVSLSIPVGERVMVPQQIAEVLNESLANEKAARRREKELSANSGRIIMNVPSREVPD